MVKVDFQESVLLVLGAFILAEQRLFQLLIGVLVHFLLPENELGVLVVFDDLDDVCVQFLNILVLLSFVDSISQSIEFFEGFRNTVFQSLAPCQSTCDWRVVVVNG